MMSEKNRAELESKFAPEADLLGYDPTYKAAEERIAKSLESGNNSNKICATKLGDRLLKQFRVGRLNGIDAGKVTAHKAEDRQKYNKPKVFLNKCRHFCSFFTSCLYTAYA